MLADLLKSVVELATKSVACSVVSVPNNPEKVIVSQSGEYEVLDVPRVPPDRHHTVKLFRDLALLFDDLVPQDADPAAVGAGIVWYDAEKVQFFTDEPHRRSVVTLPLIYSSQYTLVKKFEFPIAMEHSNMVRFLRHDLLGCGDGVAAALGAFRTINWSVVKNANAAINHGNQRIDGDITASVKDAEKKPDRILVDVPLFAMHELSIVHYPIALSVDLDANLSKIILQAEPNGLQMLEEQVAIAVGNLLAASLQEGTKIVRGTP